MHGRAAIDAQAIALAVLRDGQLAGVAGGAGQIQYFFAKLGIVVGGKSDGKISRILLSGSLIDQKSIRSHALRIGKLRRSPGYFQIDEPRIPDVFQSCALRRVIEKLAQRFVLAARPSPALT